LKLSSKGRELSWREAVSVWAVLLVPYAALFGASAPLATTLVYVLAAYLTCPRGARGAPLLPLIAVLFGLAPLGTALACAALLAIGPTLALLLAALVELPIATMRENEPGLDRFAALLVLVEWGRWPLFGGCALLALLEAGIGGLAAVALPAFLLMRRWPALGLAAAVLGSYLSGWSLAPLIVGALAAAILAWRVFASPPDLWHPFPPVAWRRPFHWLRLRRCDRRIFNGDLIGARALLRSDAGRIDERLRLAFLDVEERSYGRALALEPEFPDTERGRCAALLRARARSGIAQFEQARTDYHEALKHWRARSPFEAYLLVLIAENELAAGELGAAREVAETAHQCCRTRQDYYLRLRASSVLVECAAAGGEDPLGLQARVEALQNETFANFWIAAIGLSSDQSKLVRALFGRHGSLHQNFVRVDVLMRRAERQQEASDGWDPDAVGLAMAVAGRSDDLVELLLAEAQATGSGREAQALGLGARALIELDATRYLLAAQSARSSWSRRFGRALAVTLELAHRAEDHRFVAELLEFARVQALPASAAEGTADLALSTPPVIRLRGVSRLARPGELGRPAPVDLEAAAERATGRGGWWLSYWQAGEWLYWALVGPGSAQLESGRVAIGPGSALSAALAELEAALPFVQPDEEPAAADFRLAASPLLSDPLAERALALRLGRELLPAGLVAAARVSDIHRQRLQLAIAPAPALGFVPWGLLAIEEVDGSADRLVELCDWSIAPSATLVASAPGGDPSHPAPLRLAIADTSAATELGALVGAREQAAALPDEVNVLGGVHWSEQAATIDAFEAELRRLGPEQTVAFLCHAVRGSTAEPSRGGLVMSDSCGASEAYEVLNPPRIFAMAAAGVRMPARVLLEACDTSALADAASGEWLTLAPALLAAGSGEVITTIYPTPDLGASDDPLIGAALAGSSLREALMRTQRVGLMRWQSATGGEPIEIKHAPLSWAAYAPVCALPPSVPGPAAERRAPGELVSSHFLRALARAVKECREGHRAHLHSGYLLSAVLDESGINELFDGAANSLRPWTFFWTLGPYVCSRFLPFRDGPTRRLRLEDGVEIKVSETVIEAYKVARKNAIGDGLLLEPEYLLAAALARPSAARRILRLLSALSRRHFELTSRALAHELALRVATGQRSAEILSRGTRAEDRLALALITLVEKEALATQGPCPESVALASAAG
jgi:hypothetical protein